MAALLSLQNYDSDSGASNDDKEDQDDGFNAHLRPVDKSKSIAASMALVLAPEVVPSVSYFTTPLKTHTSFP